MHISTLASLTHHAPMAIPSYYLIGVAREMRIMNIVCLVTYKARQNSGWDSTRQGTRAKYSAAYSHADWTR